VAHALGGVGLSQDGTPPDPSALERIEDPEDALTRAPRAAGWPVASSRLLEAHAEELIARGLALGAFALPLVFTTASWDVFALPKSVAMVVLTAPIVLLLAARPSGPETRLAGTRFGVVDLLVVYLALTAAAAARSPDPIHSVIGEPLQYQGALATFLYAGAFLAARGTLGTMVRVLRLLGAVAAATALVVGYGLLQQADADPIWDVLNGGRIFSTLGQANNLAGYLVLALPLVVTLALMKAGWRRGMLLLLAGLVVVALGLTLSRGGYLGMAAAVTVYGLLLLRRPMLTRRSVLSALIAAGLVIAVAASPPFVGSSARVMTRIGQIAQVSRGSVASHLDLWAVGVRVAADHPLLGAGPEMYPVVFPRYRDAYLPRKRAGILADVRPESAHNVPIAIAAGAGIPAAMAYLLLVFGVALTAWRRARRADLPHRLLLAGLLAAAVGHVVTDLFMTAETSSSWTFWVLLGALCALSRPAADIVLEPVERPAG
jgi:O-antigen ligase